MRVAFHVLTRPPIAGMLERMPSPRRLQRIHRVFGVARRLVAMGVLWLGVGWGLPIATGEELPVEPVSSIRSLPAETADQGLPVRVRARVTYIDNGRTVFIQDETAGTFFRPTRSIEALRIGDEVDVTGITEDGLYVPGIDKADFRIVNRRANPPPAQRATYDDLSSGRLHYQRVSLHGVVRSASATDESASLIRLSLGNRTLDIHVDAPIAEAPDLINAEVRVAGLAAGGINDRRQLVQPYLRVTHWNDLQIDGPPPGEGDIPLLSVSRIMRFEPSPTNTPHRRVRVRGTVLAAFSNGHLFLRDRDTETPSSIAVHLAEFGTAKPSPGEVACVTGFPQMGGFSAHLEDAVVLSTEAGTSPEPISTGWSGVRNGALDAELIRVEATLADHYRSRLGRELRLEMEGGTLLATLPGTSVPSASPGSLVGVTGILRVESSTERGFRSQPDRFRILLRTPGDLVVLSAPPWWTAERLTLLAAILLGVVLLGLIWISLLQRQVGRQALALRDRIAGQAALEERQRIAREFHDTLEQELAGLSLRLDAATSRPLEDKTRGLITASRRLVSRIQSEARNLVADLRSESEEPRDLEKALRELTRDPPPDGPEIRLVESGHLPRLPAPMAHHLLMIAREGVTNALKHAGARSITLQWRAQGDSLTLSISDDGCGVDPEATRGVPGHFGCMGIRERCRKIAARVDWEPRKGGGTRLVVTLPLQSSTSSATPLS
jgi:signal transduction histidine kinase